MIQGAGIGVTIIRPRELQPRHGAHN
jgi:hypothetical protein